MISVLDASGRYSSQFYFGNGFWLGSNALCRELNTANSDISIVNDRPPFTVKFHVARMYINLPPDIEPSASIHIRNKAMQ